jgi:type IV pilus assembly protein PilP
MKRARKKRNNRNPFGNTKLKNIENDQKASATEKPFLNDQMALKPMAKRTILTAVLLVALSFVFSFSGCSRQPDPPPKPKVIVQRIENKEKPKQEPPATTRAPVPPLSVAAPPAAPPGDKPDGEKAGSHPSSAEGIAKELMASVSTPGGTLKPENDGVSGYNPEGKTDPFIPFVAGEPAATAGQSKREKRAPMTPLEKLDLSQLKITAIIRAPNGNKALVEETSGKGYIIQKGTFIGVNSGKVVSIENERVVIEEEMENVYGELTVRLKEMKLPKPPGE